MSRKKQTYTWRFYKEVVLSSLAIASIGLLAYEVFVSPSQAIVDQIYRFDFVVAMLFLADFMAELYLAKNKKRYIKQNWFLLLASIPLVDSWTEILRGLRLLVLVRLIRAGEHIAYATKYRRQG